MATSNSAGFDYWYGGRPAATLPKAVGQFDYWFGGRSLRVLAAVPLVPVTVSPDVGVLVLTGLVPTIAASTGLPGYVTARRRRRHIAALI